MDCDAGFELLPQTRTSQGPPVQQSVLVSQPATSHGAPVGVSVPVAVQQGPPVQQSVLVSPPATSHGAPVGVSVPVAVQQGPPVEQSVLVSQPATSHGAPVGVSVPVAVQQEPPASLESASPECSTDRPRLRSARFSDTNIVRTYSSQEIIDPSISERDPSVSDFESLELNLFEEEASVLKEYDGPAVVSALVDYLIRTLFGKRPHSSAEMCSIIDSERRREIVKHSKEIAMRFDELVTRLHALEPGQTHGLLPSNSKLTKQHAAWIQRLASWVANEIAVEPEQQQVSRPARQVAQKGRLCGICGARTIEARD